MPTPLAIRNLKGDSLKTYLLQGTALAVLACMMTQPTRAADLAAENVVVSNQLENVVVTPAKSAKAGERPVVLAQATAQQPIVVAQAATGAPASQPVQLAQANTTVPEMVVVTAYARRYAVCVPTTSHTLAVHLCHAYALVGEYPAIQRLWASGRRFSPCAHYSLLRVWP